MTTPETLLGVIGAVVVLVLTVLKMLQDRSDGRKKQKAEIDAQIDKAQDATDLVRVFDRLRNK